ncbi:MAG TPA: dienelactone hydrolase family protein [Gemmatimonadaceae bacterium]|nr:dienelactone hydrolase family protein [Gemmatimonadaceae bacterium]
MSRLIAVTCALTVASTACHHPQASAEDHTSHMAGTASGTVTGQGAVGLPASNGAAAARLAASPRRGEWIRVPFEAGSKDTILAWIVYPAAARGKAPVVVIVHDITGLSTWARAVADQAAAEGFIAVSPDFTSRPRGAPNTAELSRDSAGKLMALVNAAERSRIIGTIASYAMALPSAERRYGVVGYCWGGGTVFMHAVNGGVSGFAGGVAFYGLPYMNGAAPVGDSLAKITVPVMLFSGAKDARITAAMPAVDSAMKSLGKTYTSTNYDGAVHGFMRSQDDPKPTRDLAEEAANLTATKDAWPRTVAFLRRQLSSQ